VTAAPVRVEFPDDESPVLLDEGGPNSMAVTIGIIGDQWTLWIVEMALRGVTQYHQWAQAGPISSSVLTARLARLVDIGIMARVRYDSAPERYEYRLRARGRQLWPILVAMWDWEGAWVGQPREQLPAMRHTNCGAFFAPVLGCRACGGRTSARDVAARLGPSGRWERSIPTATTRRRGLSSRPLLDTADQAMELIGNRWSTAMMGAAFLGARRFREFEHWSGASPTIVTSRLVQLSEIGVITAVASPHRSDWVEYHLTDKGRAFYPVIALTLDWGQRWFRSPEGPAIEVEHRMCQQPFHPQLACDHCGEPLRGSAIEVVTDSGPPP
jgi:DNA-binding HxlR family transcriptional regulator